MVRSLTQIIEYCNNSIPPPCPFHGMCGGIMSSCAVVATKKTTDQLTEWANIVPYLLQLKCPIIKL